MLSDDAAQLAAEDGLDEEAVDAGGERRGAQVGEAAQGVDRRAGDANCERWAERFRRIHEEIGAMPESDTSSRFLRNRRFWHEERTIQPSKVVGWILGTQEAGARITR